MSDCPHTNLKRLEGTTLDADGQSYVCRECGAQFRVAPLVIGVSIGPPKEPR